MITIIEGTSYSGGILTTLLKMESEYSKVGSVVEAATFGPGTYVALFPWTSANEMKNNMEKYARMAVLFREVKS